MNLAVEQSNWLYALFFCLLPCWRYWVLISLHPYTETLRHNRASIVLDRAVRLIAMLAVFFLVLGLAGLHQPLSTEQRVGSGAHVVITLDRSRSMDQPFADGVQVMDFAARHKASSKGQVAREVLRDFIGSRGEDLFAFVVFSTHAIPVVPLTRKQDMLYAAIAAGDIGRGLGDTDIGEGLLQALSLFENREFSGSRIVLLVSDGAANLDLDTRRRIQDLVQEHRVAIYWLYIRTANGPDIFEQGAFDKPEKRLHRFFTRLPTVYRGYSAERPSDLKQAVADIAQLQNLPLIYDEKIPRKDYSEHCFTLALSFLLVLLFLEYLAYSELKGKEKRLL